MGREDDIGKPGPDAVDQKPVQRRDFAWRRIADGVGHIQGRGPGFGYGFQHLGQKLRLCADGVLGAELDIVEPAACILDRANGGGQNLILRHLQLGSAMDRTGAQEDVDAAAQRRFQSAPGSIDITLRRA